jgi:hypothetical protein
MGVRAFMAMKHQIAACVAADVHTEGLVHIADPAAKNHRAPRAVHAVDGEAARRSEPAYRFDVGRASRIQLQELVQLQVLALMDGQLAKGKGIVGAAVCVANTAKEEKNFYLFGRRNRPEESMSGGFSRHGSGRSFGLPF